MGEGIMPCCRLYCICLLRRRSVSSMVTRIDSVILSAYIMTLPFTLRAARPAVCVSDRWLRRKPSLSASSMATRLTWGRSSPSLKRFTPIKTSYSPSRRSSRIFIRSSVSTSLCMYAVRIPILRK